METNNKLREALTKIHHLTNSLDEDCGVDPVEIRDIARAALAEPVRNCDLYKTKEEAQEAFLKEPCDHPCGNCWVEDIDNECGVDWLLAPATEKEGGAK